jgi:hypothetical protein
METGARGQELSGAILRRPDHAGGLEGLGADERPQDGDRGPDERGKDVTGPWSDVSVITVP